MVDSSRLLENRDDIDDVMERNAVTVRRRLSSLSEIGGVSPSRRAESRKKYFSGMFGAVIFTLIAIPFGKYLIECLWLVYLLHCRAADFES